VGGSVTGRVVSGIATERIAVSVTAGDTLDLLVRLDLADALLFGSHLRSAETPWLKESVRTSQGITLYGAVVPSAAGTYMLEVVGDMICGGRYCVPPSGSYVVRVRRSAPIFNVSRYYERAFLTLPEGALGRDSVWAQNVGVGTATVRATSPVSWLRPDSVAVALVGPKVGGATPDVATAIGATVDARGVAQGAYDESLDLDASTGEWSPFRPFGHHFRRVQLLVTDSSARLLSATARLPRLAAGSDGKLYGAVNDSVLAIDPVSGALSLVVRLPFQPTQLAVGADGALYVRRQSVDAGGVYKITNGSAELVLDLRPSDGPFAVLPDGTIYGFSGPALYRGSPGGAQQRVATFTFSDYPSSIVYRAADDALYIVYGGQLWRHDRARAETTVRGTLTEIGTFRLYAVDAQGRLYGTVPYVKQEVRVLDVDGGVLDRRVLADIPQALTISGGTIFVTTGTSLWRLPVR
jgi:hypothetical protein